MQLNKNVNKFLGWILVFALLVGFFVTSGCENGHGEQEAAPPPIPEVAVVTLSTQTVLLTTELPGRTSAFRIAEIRPQVSGIIQKRLFTEGAEVKARDVLYQIDPAPFQAALDNAKAYLAKAEANLPAVRSKAERYKKLMASNAVSQQDYDDRAAALLQAEAEVEYWKASVKTAHINLGYTRITAPISGRIGRSNVTDGALVTAYQPQELTTIQQIDPIYVDVAQSATELQRLKRSLDAGRLKQSGEGHKKVNLILQDGTPYPVEGTLQFRDVSVDPTTGSVILRAIFPNPDGILLPGMFVRAVVQEGVAERAILAPQQGVSRNSKGEPIALIVDEAGQVQQRRLILDRAINNQWLVTSGLSGGERLIVEGMLNVRPGITVTVVPFESSKTDSKNGQKTGTMAETK
jgi:membrane fusion protein, multidrug efflux system